MAIDQNGRSSSLTGTEEDFTKFAEQQEQSLIPIKEEVVEWLQRTLQIDITSDSFVNVLDNGVYLCKLAQLIQDKAVCAVQQSLSSEKLPEMKIRCKVNAQPGSWFARDNTATFLKWCREFNVKEECLFESEDLVAHKQEKQVVLCLMELARIGSRFGIEPPNLIKMEKEIDKEEEELEKTPSPVKVVEVINKPSSAKLAPHEGKVDLDKEVRRIATKCHCSEHVKRISEGQYMIFGRTIFIRLLKDRHLMVRVGGGWDTLEHYLIRHNPIKVLSFNRPEGNDKFLFIKSKYKCS